MYKRSIAGSLSWLSEAEHVQGRSGVRNLYPTINTFTGVLYGLLAVVLYTYHIYYSNTFCFILYYASFSALFNVTILVQLIACCLFSFPLLMLCLYVSPERSAVLPIWFRLVNSSRLLFRSIILSK